MIMRWMTRIACVVALTLIAFAHQTPSGIVAHGTPNQSELAGYVLPDGYAPFICATGKPEGGRHDGKAYLHGCEACRVGAAILLMGPADEAGLPDRCDLAASRFTMFDLPLQRIVAPDGRPRAPPGDRMSA